MKPAQTRPSVGVPVSALALAASAAVAFTIGGTIGFLSDAAEDLFILTWLMGSILLAWAVILGGGYAVWLGIQWYSRKPVPRLAVVLAAASLLLISGVIAAHPLWGSGSGYGT